MRHALAFLLAATFAAAEGDLELARRVDGLVKELGAETAEERTLAVFRLAAYGEKIRPLLERVESDDPEVRRAIRYLTRSVGKMQLDLLSRPEGPLKIGAPFVLDVRIVNNTDLTHALLPEAGRQGEASPFRVRVGGRTLAPVRFDQVNWGGEGAAVIPPGGMRRFRLSLDGSSSPLRRPALYEVSVVFNGPVARGYGPVEENGLDTVPLFLESAPVRIHVLGRKADELEKALGSEDAREREAAARELSLREDDAVVPVLRRHATEPALRLAAIRRLGAAGVAEDFDLILEATRDANADVRRAAVIGLAKHKTPAARRRLLMLVSDQELQWEAIRALRGHKHPATVERLVKLLATGHCSLASIGLIRATLLEWTGLAVDERPSEIRAFNQWWEANGKRWAEENASDK